MKKYWKLSSFSSFKRDWSPRNGFLPFSQKVTPFLKKLLNNKIFNTSFVIKKSYIKFLRKTPPFPEKFSQMRPQNSFSQFSQKIRLFSKKLSNKKMFSIKFLIKKVIFIFGVRWSLTVAQWPSSYVANQVFFVLNIALLTHFLLFK